MASDSGHVRCVREAFGERQGITEKAMFGGRAVLVDGKMFVGIQEPTLMARVGPGRHQDAGSVRSASEQRAAMRGTALEPRVDGVPGGPRGALASPAPWGPVVTPPSTDWLEPDVP